MAIIRGPTAAEQAAMAAGPTYSGAPEAIYEPGVEAWAPTPPSALPGAALAGLGVLSGVGMAMTAVQPGAETEEPVLEVGITNGVAATLGEEIIYPAVTAPAAIPAAFPLAGALAAVMSLGVFKALLAKFGPYLAKVLVGALAFAGFMKLLSGGASDDVQLPIKPGQKKKRRYSIGANPRVRTLQKVSRHCMRLLKRHRKVIDEFLPPKRQGMPARALARTYLSTAERKLLKA